MLSERTRESERVLSKPYVKTTRVAFGASEWELVHAEALRAGMSTSEYIRAAAHSRAADAHMDLRAAASDVQVSAAAVFQVNADWTEWREVSGADDQAKPGSGVWVDSFVHADDRDRVSLTLQGAIASRDVFESHHRAHAAAGEHHVYSRGLPLVGDDGEIIEWLCVVSSAADGEPLTAAASRADPTGSGGVKRFY